MAQVQAHVLPSGVTQCLQLFEQRASGTQLSQHNTTGEANFLLQVVARDLDSYSRFVEKVLRKLPGVLSIRSNLSLREMKTTQRFPLAELLSIRGPALQAGFADHGGFNHCREFKIKGASAVDDC